MKSNPRNRYHLACVVGARPNFMKMAPILRALDEYPEIQATLIHTGQHYDRDLSDIFFEELGIREPDVCLNVRESKQGAQTARMLEAFEHLFETAAREIPFDRLVVVGDVNSSLAATLAASKMGIAVAHVEAGLRSFDRTMPEEINRVVIDSVADTLFVSEPEGVNNLRREGHADESIRLVGNVMIDTLLRMLPLARSSSMLERFNLKPKEYGLVTFHRPANVDTETTLADVVGVLCQAADQMRLVFPIHPRTRKRLEEFDLLTRLERTGIDLIRPLGYVDCLALSSQAKVILTDSGGLQEEATVLGVPCLTMRPNTERPVTIDIGTNTLVGNDPARIAQGFANVSDGSYKVGKVPEFWDGQAAVRIAAQLVGEAAERNTNLTATKNQTTPA
ncbi:MAG TPA: UDP-N-acetylglucosamine 2-epimerase (non-hydrolyzing) [Pirellulaceae bacterium]|jgi:UDP-N-acetylglucosamine 2-epimerase (non-hydrolysing)|nr:UDP-N-acetylglucosamine 2-epimerase (non-hydrolyzing) [Pirellulaceae bacterium]